MAFREACPHATMTTMTSDWKPTDDNARTYTRYRKAVEIERELHDPIRDLAAEDLRAGASVTQLARLTGLTPEVFRRIARAEGVARKRPPTVGAEVASKNRTQLD